MTKGCLEGLCEWNFKARLKLSRGILISDVEMKCVKCENPYEEDSEVCVNHPLRLQERQRLEEEYPGAFLR